MEIFCGTAGVSAAFKRKGFSNYIAIDKLTPRAPKASITKLDLTVHANQQLVFSWIRAGMIQAIFLAPPCGTASLARTIELDDVPDAPVPSRSFEQPDGLDNLAGVDLLRVSQADTFMISLRNVGIWHASATFLAWLKILLIHFSGWLLPGSNGGMLTKIMSNRARLVVTDRVVPSGPSWWQTLLL